LISGLRELWKYRELLVMLTQRDLKIRYKNSALGFAWSLLNPLLQVAIITVVLKIVMRMPVENYHLYVFCASLPWLFFSTAVLDTSFSLVQYEALIRKVYFPRQIIPLVAVCSNFVHFALATGVFLLYALGNAVWNWGFGGRFDFAVQPLVLLTPIPILGLALLVTAAAMVLSVWTFYFHDVRFLADSALRVLYWVVPVLYWPEMLLSRERGQLFYNLYMLNPLSSLIDSFRRLMLVPGRLPGPNDTLVPMKPMGGQEWLFLGIAVLVSAALALLGTRYFESRKSKLAERA
jgi:ABC-type polysaccharide/polyol phosphate export permease